MQNCSLWRGTPSHIFSTWCQGSLYKSFNSTDGKICYDLQFQNRLILFFNLAHTCVHICGPRINPQLYVRTILYSDPIPDDCLQLLHVSHSTQHLPEACNLTLSLMDFICSWKYSTGNAMKSDTDILYVQCAVTPGATMSSLTCIRHFPLLPTVLPNHSEVIKWTQLQWYLTLANTVA